MKVGIHEVLMRLKKLEEDKNDKESRTYTYWLSHVRGLVRRLC